MLGERMPIAALTTLSRYEPPLAVDPRPCAQGAYAVLTQVGSGDGHDVAGSIVELTLKPLSSADRYFAAARPSY